MNAGSDSQTPGFSPGLNSSTRIKLKPNLLNIIQSNNNVSNINSSNEEENLIKSRREAKEAKEAKLTINHPLPQSHFAKDITEESDDKSTSRIKLKKLMNSKVGEIVLVGLIIIYTILVAANIVLDTGSCENNSTIDDIVLYLKYIEIFILLVFVLELALKVLGSGFKGYFRDGWYIIDTILLSATLALVIVDVEINDRNIAGLSRIRGIFRLFRIALLFRKVSEFSRITSSKIRTKSIDLKSPVEKVLALLSSFKLNSRDKSLVQEIDWAIDVVSTNKLYDPLLDSNFKNPMNVDVKLWLKSYGSSADLKMKKRNSKINARETVQRLSLLAPTPMKRNSSMKFVSSAISITPDVNDMLDKEIDLLSFDVFAFKKVAKGDELTIISTYLFQRHNFFEYLNINQVTFTNFMRKIQSGYRPNPYHNDIHAADAVQTVNYMLTTGEYMGKADLNNIDIASMYLAAAIHDYEHPGTNNVFQIGSGSMLATRYNDKAVLESHHVAASFALLKEEGYNIFANFSKSDYKIVRERIIAMVLATDMSTHFSDISRLKGRLAADFDMKDKDKHFTMELIVHAADISNPTKHWEECKEWTLRITQEFFNQGDRERDLGIPITHLCDKFTTNIAKSQIGFIDFVAAPLFVQIKEFLPGIDISNLEANKTNWKELFDFYDQELAKINAEKINTLQKVMG